MRQPLSIIFLVFLIFINAQPGSVDVTFNPSDLGFGFGDGANDYVKDILLQQDGKIIIGGDFTAYNTNSARSLARINSNGSIDTSFLVGSGANGYVSSMIAQPDGKLIVCGNFTTFNGAVRNRIVRLNSDGSIDFSFSTGTGADNVIECIALQSDGKILIGGQFVKFNGFNRKYITRLKTDGSVDDSFDSSAGFNSHVYSLAVQPDGKIIAGGNFSTYKSVTKNYIVRINPDASIDQAFETAGTNNIIYKILLAEDGKILIGGKFTKYNNTTKNGITRINPDATADEQFITGNGANNIVRNILILHDKKIMLAGDFTTYAGVMRNYVAKINEDGTLDSGFNPGKGFGASVTSFQQQSDGKLIVGGSFAVFNNNVKHYLARIDMDGTLDSAFNPGNAADGTVRNIAVQNDGKLILVGDFNSFNDQQNNRIARIDPDGSVDSTLQTGLGADLTIRALAAQNDGKIIIGGDFSTFNGIAKSYLVRLTAKGAIDNDFKIGYGPTGSVRDILVQPDGKILICGDFTVFNTKSANRILRLNADGSIDSAFQPFSGANNSILSMKLQMDHKILIGGSFTTFDGVARNRLARLNDNGTLDSSFTIGAGANGNITDIAIQPDGKIVFGGNFTSFASFGCIRIARANADGSRDATFSSSVGANAAVESILLQDNGKILIGGGFTKYNNVNRNNLARLHPDGSLDFTFNNNSGGANKPIYKLINQAGEIIAGGDFTSYNNTGRNRITRIIAGEEAHLAANESNNKKIQIYPNPTSDKLFISSSSKLKKFGIYDFTGKMLFENNFEGTSYNIDVRSLKTGIYILRIININQNVESHKFIIE